MKRLILAALVLPLAIGACSSVKKSLGMEKTTPDEFAVVERAPLTMPPNFDLMPPEPGAPRPQDVNVRHKAQNLVLGSESTAPAPAANGAKAPAASGSAVEKALLSSAGATAQPSTIRKDLAGPDDDKDSETMSQRLGITESKSGKALNPTEEAKRLQKSSVKTVPVTKEDADAALKAADKAATDPKAAQ